MLKESSISLAELLLNSGTQKSYKPGEVIQSISENSYGVAPYQVDNATTLKEELRETTLNNVVHNEIMDAASTKLADIIRNSLYDIRRYANDIIVLTANNVHRGDSEIEDTGASAVRFVSSDCPLINSDIVPKETPKAPSIDLESGFITLDSGRNISFKLTGKKDILELIPETNGLRGLVEENTEEDFFLAGGVFDELGSRTEGDDYHFDSITNVNNNKLFVLYLLSVIAQTKKEPLDLFSNISLTQYGLIMQLIRVVAGNELIRRKADYSSMSRLQLVIRGTSGLMAKRMVIDDNEGPHRIEMRGNEGPLPVVYYSQNFLDNLASQGIAIRSVVNGYFYEKLVVDQNASVASVVADPAKYRDITIAQRKEIEDFKALSIVDELSKEVMSSFVEYISKDEVLLASVNERASNEGITGPEYLTKGLGETIRKLIFSVRKELALATDYNWTKRNDLVTNAVINSSIVSDFLRLIGSVTAAEILENTEHLSKTDGQDKRKEALARSVVQKIIASVA